MQLGQIMNMIQKDEKPPVTSEVLGAKAGGPGMIPANGTTKGVGRPPKPLSSLTHGPTPTLIPFEGPVCPTSGSEQGKLLFFFLLSLQSLAWFLPLASYQLLLTKEYKNSGQ